MERDRDRMSRKKTKQKQETRRRKIRKFGVTCTSCWDLFESWEVYRETEAESKNARLGQMEDEKGEKESRDRAEKAA